MIWDEIRTTFLSPPQWRCQAVCERLDFFFAVPLAVFLYEKSKEGRRLGFLDTKWKLFRIYPMYEMIFFMPGVAS